MSEIKCKCKKSAIKICKQHRLFLCNSCSQDHKCNLISLKVFKKELDETYMNKMTIFQNFKKQRSNFLYSSKKTHEENHQKSHETIKNLENIYDKYLEIVKTKQNTFLKNMMDFKQDKLEDELRTLERTKKQFQLLDRLNSGEIDSIEQKFNTISIQIKEFEKNNILTQTVQQILEDMTKKFKEQFEYLQGINFHKIDDMIKSAKKISDIYFSQKSANIIKRNIKKSIMLTQTVIKQTVMINTFNEKLDDNNSQINSDIGSLNSDEMEIDTSEDEIIINNNLQGRGTQLISNDIFKSNLNPRNHQLDQVKEQSLEEDLSGSNLSFEVDDIELEDDVDSIQRDYQEDFERNKNRFCAILDQVLFDVNCIGFFDKNERNKINQYFDQMKVTLNQLVGDLKSNFSKMQLISLNNLQMNCRFFQHSSKKLFGTHLLQMKPQTIRTLSNTSRFHFSSKQHFQIAEQSDQSVTLNLNSEVVGNESQMPQENEENELSRMLEDCELTLSSLRLVDICGINSTQRALSEPMHW